MGKILFGVILGIVVTTVGFSGLANMADKGVAKVVSVTKEVAASDAVDEAKATAKKAVKEVTK